MNTDTAPHVETIKAVASLWPLALIVLFAFVIVVVLIFFLPQARTFFERLSRLRIKAAGAEISVNDQPPPEVISSAVRILRQEVTTGISSPAIKDALSSEPAKIQPALEQGAVEKMYLCLIDGRMDDAANAFTELMREIDDPSERIKTEAVYLRLRYEKGDGSARAALEDLETKVKSVPGMVGIVQRVEGLCYVFSRNHIKAIERFKQSAANCISEDERVTSLLLAAKSLFEVGSRSEAYGILEGQIPRLQSDEIKVQVLLGIAEFFHLDGKLFERALFLQRALALHPNSKELNFNTAYAFADAGMNGLAMLHYEKLIEIDPRYSNALNNLGVAFAALKIQSMAVISYKRAILLGETLAASNLAYIMIEAGELETAAKILLEAQKQKDVDPRIGGALVKLEGTRESDEETRTALLKKAHTEFDFQLGYVDAYFLSGDLLSDVKLKWSCDQFPETSFAYNEFAETVELSWSNPVAQYQSMYQPTERFKFNGVLKGLTASGPIAVAKTPPSIFSVSPPEEGKFEPHGSGFGYFTEGATKFLLQIRPASGEVQQLVFTKQTKK